MQFGEKLKALRGQAKMTQDELAAALGVSKRTIRNYETSSLYPRDSEVYRRLARIFSVSVDYLLSEEDRYVIEAGERGGAPARREVAQLVAEVGGLFAGGALSEEDKDKVMKAINDLYWEAKENNRKYGKK